MVGPNGSGKTTLLRLIAGVMAPTDGTLRVLDRARITFLDQHAALLGDAGVLAEVAATRLGSSDLQVVRHALARVGFRGESGVRRIETLSGGERVRAALACVLLAPKPPQLLLLDEPTNHLDLNGLQAVESALNGYDGAIIVVSHDETFLKAIEVTRNVALSTTTHGREAPPRV